MKFIKDYLFNNIFLNFLLLVSISIIILFQVTQKSPVFFNLDVVVVNYYFEILVNISVGYIVSLTFYILVVYYPEKKRNNLIKATTSRIFARLQTNFSDYIFATLKSFKLPFEATEDIKKAFIDKIYSLDPEVFKLLRESPNIEFIGKGDSHLDVIQHSSKNILSLKQSLIPFLLFMDADEVDCYTEIEDILIFENMDKIEEDLPVDMLFLDDFEFIVKTYYKVQKIVGASKAMVEYDPKYDELIETLT